MVKELGNAKSTVLVQAYSFTSVPIAKALVDAHKRGVQVQVILDKSQKGEKYSSADFVINAGIPTKIDAKHAIAHNKIMVIDGETVITGSFNFTRAAESSNAENLLVIRDKVLADKYTANWHAHDEHSDTYVKRNAVTPKRIVPQRRRSPTLRRHRLPADLWPQHGRRCSTGQIASRRPKSRRRTSFITPLGKRRSKLARGRAGSASRSLGGFSAAVVGWRPQPTACFQPQIPAISNMFGKFEPRTA